LPRHTDRQTVKAAEDLTSSPPT